MYVFWEYLQRNSLENELKTAAELPKKAESRVQALEAELATVQQELDEANRSQSDLELIPALRTELDTCKVRFRLFVFVFETVAGLGG